MMSARRLSSVRALCEPELLTRALCFRALTRYTTLAGCLFSAAGVRFYAPLEEPVEDSILALDMCDFTFRWPASAAAVFLTAAAFVISFMRLLGPCRQLDASDRLDRHLCRRFLVFLPCGMSWYALQITGPPVSLQ